MAGTIGTIMRAIAAGGCFYFFPLFFGNLLKGDLHNCLNPTVTSEEKECAGGKGQEKRENCGTMCGKLSLEIIIKSEIINWKIYHRR